MIIRTQYKINANITWPKASKEKLQNKAGFLLRFFVIWVKVMLFIFQLKTSGVSLYTGRWWTTST